jgi:peptide-methionine (R)-S-oxide reductase
MDTKIIKTEQEWCAQLTPHQYEILRRKATEPALSGEYTFSQKNGTYHCVACGSELFSSEAKASLELRAA